MARPRAPVIPLHARSRSIRKERAGNRARVGQSVGAESLGQVYIRQYGAMKDFIRRRVGSEDVAEELIQEAWLAVAPRADDPSIENPEAWLQRVVVNLALNWLKTHHFRSKFVSQDVDESRDDKLRDKPHDAPSAERVLEYRQGLDQLMLLIDDLPPGRRAAFLLCRGEGLSLKEAADRLQISIKTVSLQVSAAVSSLRSHLIAAGLWP
jgi:RNA polymerase sigma factor (sigma-70 family)